MSELGFFPDLTRPSHMSDEKWRLIKLIAIKKAIISMLEPLLHSAEHGMQLVDPNGNLQVRTCVVFQARGHVSQDSVLSLACRMYFLDF